MIRWVPAALMLSACLDSPPAAIDEGSSLVLGGVDARGELTLDGRSELVIAGTRVSDSGEQPIALVLFASDSGIEAAVSGGVAIELSDQPSDIAIARREDLTGLAILLGPDGSLDTLDQDGAIEELTPTDGDVPLDLPFDRVASLETSPGHRVLLAHGGDLWVTQQLVADQPLSDYATELLSSGDGIDRFDGVSAGGSLVVAALTAAGDIDVRVFTGNPPSLEPDLVTEQTPGPLGSVLWRGTSHDFVYLVGVDLGTPRLFWHRTPLGAGEATSGYVLDGDYDLIHDITFAVVGGGAPDLVVLGERSGALVVDMYGDPLSNDAFDVGSPASWPVPGDLAAPVWVEAMDAVSGDGGDIEIVVYDQSGHIACADRGDPGMLSSCGSANLADLVGG